MRVGYNFRSAWRLAVASPVAVSKLVEGRHLRVEPPALDGQHQTGAVELGLAQVGAIGHLAVGLAAVTRPAMTRLAVAFLLKESHAIGNVGGVEWFLLLSLRSSAECHCHDRDRNRRP